MLLYCVFNLKIENFISIIFFFCVSGMLYIGIESSCFSTVVAYFIVAISIDKTHSCGGAYFLFFMHSVPTCSCARQAIIQKHPPPKQHNNRINFLFTNVYLSITNHISNLRGGHRLLLTTQKVEKQNKVCLAKPAF